MAENPRPKGNVLVRLVRVSENLGREKAVTPAWTDAGDPTVSQFHHARLGKCSQVGGGPVGEELYVCFVRCPEAKMCPGPGSLGAEFNVTVPIY